MSMSIFELTTILFLILAYNRVILEWEGRLDNE